VLDDRGDPRRAEALAREALEGGTLALVCCTTAAATDRVSRIAEQQGVLLLALDAARPPEGAWTMQLAPSARTVMTAAAVHAAAEGKAALALMTLDTAFGDEAEASFERAVAVTGREVVSVVRYPAGAEVLTPEGLQVAAREPGAVIVWGLPDDTSRALQGLRRRGFLGPVYVRPASLPESAWRRVVPLDALPEPVVPTRDDPWLGVRVAVPPAAVHAMLPPEHPSAPAVAAAIARLGGQSAIARPAYELVEMATVDDAVQLILYGFEGVAALALPLEIATVALRLAMRDALHAAPPVALATGSFAPRALDTRATRWDGLVLVTVAR
jgi:hypothetical protein